MKYLLDTDAIVDHLRGKKNISASFIKEGSAISIITYAELYYGAHKSEKTEENIKKIKAMLSELAVEVVNLSEAIADVYGETKAILEKKGERLDEFDLLIVSTALSLNLQLVTRNRKHFQRIPRLRMSKVI